MANELRVPTVKGILNGLEWLNKLDRSPEVTAKLVRKVLEDKKSPTTNKFRKCNELLETYGIENLSFRLPKLGNRQYMYLNTGDPYIATLMFCYETGEIFIGNWGYFAERDLDNRN